MIVCHCHRVTDRAIRRAVADGATCRHSVARACRAGSGCGGCAEAIDDVIAESLGEGEAGHVSLDAFAPVS